VPQTSTLPRPLPSREGSVLGGFLQAAGREEVGLAADDFGGDAVGGAAFELGQLEHVVEHELFGDGAEGAGAGVAVDGLLRDFAEGVVGEFELGVFHLEQLLVLPDDGVLGLGHDLDQGGLVERGQRADHRQAADELGDDAEFDQVVGREACSSSCPRSRLVSPMLSSEAKPIFFLPRRFADDLVEADEGAAADEEDVGGVELDVLLLGVLAAALGRDVG
jgi:hypothetical protein